MLENFGKYKNKTKKKQVILLSFLSVSLSRFRSLGKFRKMKLKIFGRQNIFSTHTHTHTDTADSLALHSHSRLTLWQVQHSSMKLEL